MSIGSTRIQKEHTCIRQSRHATLVVRAGIHVVHPDSVGAQLRHADDVALTLGRIDQRVTWGQLISNACLGQPSAWQLMRSQRDKYP
jgi:hypothetical protein